MKPASRVDKQGLSLYSWGMNTFWSVLEMGSDVLAGCFCLFLLLAPVAMGLMWLWQQYGKHGSSSDWR